MVLYGALRDRARDPPAPAAEEAAFRNGLRGRLGADKEHFIALLDRLLFEEENIFGPP